MDLISVLWTTVLPFLVILTIVVFVHEFGHFIVARMNGVKVDVFSIGFGRELLGWYDRHGTRWRVSLLPLGGYVKFFGDANEASGGTDKTRELTEAEKAVSFHHKRVGQRFAVVLAGPAFNFLFAILVFAGIFMTVGQPPTPLLDVSVSGEAMEVRRMGPVQAIGSAVGHTWGVVSSSMTAIGQMITGSRGTEDLGGPVRIAQFSGQAAQSGVVNAIMFVALLSVALGLFNLFPIPMLDGGHLLFYLFEMVRGQPLSEGVQEAGFRIGLVLVLGLMVFVTWNDIVRLIEG